MESAVFHMRGLGIWVRHEGKSGLTEHMSRYPAGLKKEYNKRSITEEADEEMSTRERLWCTREKEEGLND